MAIINLVLLKIASNWITVQNVQDTIAVETLHLSLGIGESEAIILAKELNLPLIIDDKAGRRTAKALDVDVTGTIGILLLGAQEDLLDINEILPDLNSIGFRVSPQLISRLYK